MNLKRRKQFCWLLAVLLMAGGVAVVCLAFVLPYAQPDTIEVKTKAVQRKAGQQQDRAVELEQFTGLWDKNLRPPLIDAPKEVVPENTQANVPKPKRPDIKLIGFAIESEGSLAMLKAPDNSIAFVGVGEELQGVTVHAITAEGVTLDFNGDRYLLPIDEEADAARPTPNIRRADRRSERPVRY